MPDRLSPVSFRRILRAAAGAALLAGALAATLVPVAGAAAGPPVLYGATGGANSATDSDLYTIDPDTGAATSVGPIGQPVTGLALDPTSGILYGVTAHGNLSTEERDLITINRSTGAGTVVGSLGSTGANANRVADIGFDAAGGLFGWNRTDNDLATIDKATGTVTTVADSGQSTYGDGMSFDKDGVLYVMGEGENGDLWTVDPSTGQVTTVATLNGTPNPPGTNAAVSAAAFACDGTSLFATLESFGTPPTYLVTVNTATGEITSKGVTQPTLDALEWVCPNEVTFNVASVNVDEAAGNATLGITRTGGRPNQAVTVDFATANGSAVAGQDYTASSGSRTFAAGETTKTITVPIANDTAQEAQESFTVKLTNPTAGATLGIATETVNIPANDTPVAAAAPLGPLASGCEGFDLEDVDADRDTRRLIVDLTTYCPGTITVRATARFSSAAARSSATVRIRARTLRSRVPRSSLRLRLRIDRPASLRRALRAGRTERISTRVSFRPTTGPLQAARRSVTIR